MCSFIRIFKIFNWFEERPYNCCLLISIQVSRLGFNFAIRISIPFWILFRIILLFVFVRRFHYFLKSRGRFEHLIFTKSILEGFIFYLQQFSIRINIIIFDLTCSQRVNISKIRFFKLTTSWRIGIYTSW